MDYWAQGLRTFLVVVVSMCVAAAIRGVIEGWQQSARRHQLLHSYTTAKRSRFRNVLKRLTRRRT